MTGQKILHICNKCLVLAAMVIFCIPLYSQDTTSFSIEAIDTMDYQLTEHLNVTPDVQLTFNPSFNDEKSFVGVYSVLRIRYAL